MSATEETSTEANPEAEPQRLRARDLNEMIRYTMWSVFRVTGSGALEAAGSVAGLSRDGLADEVSTFADRFGPLS